VSVHLNEAEAMLAMECLRRAGGSGDQALLAAKLRHGVLDLSNHEADVLMGCLEVVREGQDAYFKAHDVTLTILWRKLETP
jgi:hypothetical protein